MSRPIVFLSDFGLDDSYVGQVKAVIASIAPGAPVIDLTHAITPYAIDEGVWLLEGALPLLPSDAVVLAVVDPGVGGARRELAVVRGGRAFVGPDNGLLSPAFSEDERLSAPATGGPVAIATPAGEVRELCSPQFRRATVSHTFHGRDIFGPAAAYLSLGIDVRHMGPPAAAPFLLPPFAAVPSGSDRLEGRVIHIDRYGNLITTIRAAQLFPAFEVHIAGRVIDRHVRTFSMADPAVPFCHVDSSGFLVVALNQQSAAASLSVTRGDAAVVVRR